MRPRSVDRWRAKAVVSDRGASFELWTRRFARLEDVLSATGEPTVAWRQSKPVASACGQLIRRRVLAPTKDSVLLDHDAFRPIPRHSSACELCSPHIYRPGSLNSDRLRFQVSCKNTAVGTRRVVVSVCLSVSPSCSSANNRMFLGQSKQRGSCAARM